MKTALVSPWRGVHRIGLHPRLNPRQEYAPDWNTPSPTLALDARRALQEAQLVALVQAEDPARRRLALGAFNDRAQAYGDHLVRLASSALFPNQQTQGVPAAVTFGDNDRWVVDTRWTNLFLIQDRRAQTHPFFKLVDLYHAVQVKKYLIGERIQFGFVEAAQEIFEAEIFGLGLQWNQLWSEWQADWTPAEGMAAMQARWAAFQASQAWATLTASGLSTTAYDTTGATVLEKDINTINQGMMDIRLALYQATAPKGGQQVEEKISDATPYYLLYNSNTAGYENRVNRALEARFTILNAAMSVAEVNRPVVPVGDPDIPTGAWYLALAGRKNVLAVFRDLRFYDFNDPRIAGIAQGEVGQGAYKFVRGDVRQSRKLLLA